MPGRITQGGHYPFGAGAARTARRGRVAFGGPEDGVSPAELARPQLLPAGGLRAASARAIRSMPNAEHKRSDFEDLRDFALDHRGTLPDLAKCYKYWIALTDCDGSGSTP